MIVDCHMHTWRYPDHFVKDVWLSWQPRHSREWPDEKWKSISDNPVESYLSEAEGLVDMAVIQGVANAKSMGIDVPNDYVAGVVRKYPNKFMGCACINPAADGAVEELERCVRQLGLIGLGELGPAYQHFYPHDQKCFPVWERAQELGVPVFIHADFAQPRYARLIFANPAYIDEVAVSFPDLKIVICHLGYHHYEDYAHIIQKHENIFGDVSWMAGLAGLDRRKLPRRLPVVDFAHYYHLLRPLVYYFSQTFGATDKLLFGSDWTVGSPRKAIEVLSNINPMLKALDLPAIPEETIHNVLHENWKKVIKIERKLG